MIIKDRVMDENGTYVINDKVMFSPDTNSLHALDGAANPIFLHTPSSQCLLILLQNNNAVVSQKILFEEVWEKNGTLVSANTLYQNIALLRKALKTLSIDEEIIKTIPKQGFKLSAQVSYREYLDGGSCDENILETQDQLSIEDNVSSVNNPVIAPDPSPVVVRAPHDVKEHEDIVKLIVKLKGSFFFKYVLPLIFSTIFLSILYPAFLTQLRLGKDFFSSYYSLGEIDKCAIYSSFDVKEASLEKFKKLARASKLVCKPGNVVYLTFNRQYGQDSMVFCDKSIRDDTAHCKTIIYQETILNEN